MRRIGEACRQSRFRQAAAGQSQPQHGDGTEAVGRLVQFRDDTRDARVEAAIAFLRGDMCDKVGERHLLFVDFEKGNRLRAQGRASVRDDDPLLRRHAKAELIVRVAVSVLFPNCPRYVHRYGKEAQSAFVPHADREPPLADWKRLDLVHEALPEPDHEVEAAGGPITREEMLRNAQR